MNYNSFPLIFPLHGDEFGTVSLYKLKRDASKHHLCKARWHRFHLTFKLNVYWADVVSLFALVRIQSMPFGSSNPKLG